MVLLIVIVILAALMAWLCFTHLPQPVNWIAGLLIILLAVAYLFSGNVQFD